MNKLLILASCLVLAAPTISTAQTRPDKTRPAPEHGHRPGKPGGGNRPGNGNGGGGHHRPNPGRPGGHKPNPGRPGIPPMPGRPPHNRPPHNRPPHHRPPHHRPPYRPGRPGFGWNGHRFRIGLFHYPAGYGYRRWERGQTLPLVFLSSAYYFTNYAALGLDPPPFGYQWVRYGPDVLLVNVRTGQVMDVEYNVFY